MADDWLLDGKPVTTPPQSYTPRPGGRGGSVEPTGGRRGGKAGTEESVWGGGDTWKLDGKPIGPITGDLRPNRGAEAKKKSLIYGIPAAMKDAGFEKTGNVVEGGLDALAGIGSGIANTVLGAADAVIPDSIEPDFIKQGRGLMHDIGDMSTPASVGQGAEQFGEFFAPVPGTGKLKAATQGAGILKRGLLTGAKDALQVGTVEHAQSGGDFSRSIPAAIIGGGMGAATGVGGGIWDATASMTHDVDPTRAAAAAYGKSEGVTVDPTTRSGSPLIRNTKKFLSSGPNAPEAENLSNLQDVQFDALGNRLVQQSGPSGVGSFTPMNPSEAGQSAYDALTSSMQGKMQKADQAYGGFRTMTRMLPDVQVNVVSPGAPPSGILGPNGLPVTGPGTVVKNFKIPVDRSSAQAALKPMLDQWEAVLPVTEKNASRGLLALRSLVYGDSVVEADTALKDLHALYEAQKLESGQISRDLNQSLASKVMKEYRDATDQSISSVNPSLLNLVNEGRQATGEKYAIQKLMKTLGGRVDPGNAYSPPSLKPVQVYDALARTGDHNITALRQFQSEAPGEVKNIASTLLQGMLDKSSTNTANASFSRAATSLTDWTKVGTETKQILFGPQLTSDLDNFFRLGKYLSENPNPSNTGMHVWMAARLMSVLKNPMLAGKDFAFELALGKYMFSDRGPLPYISQIAPGKMGVNPASALVGGAFRLATGIDPASFQKQENQK